MGNYVSCALSGHNKTPTTVKVIFPGGEIRSFDEAVTAAELMLEEPNSFLVNSRSLHINRRFSPLSADEELEMGNVYVLFPKQRLNSLVNTFDMGALFLTAKRGSSLTKNENDHLQVMSVSNLNLEDNVDTNLLSVEVKHRLYKCRSNKPLLETIVE